MTRPPRFRRLAAAACAATVLLAACATGPTLAEHRAALTELERSRNDLTTAVDKLAEADKERTASAQALADRDSELAAARSVAEIQARTIDELRGRVESLEQVQASLDSLQLDRLAGAVAAAALSPSLAPAPIELGSTEAVAAETILAAANPASGLMPAAPLLPAAATAVASGDPSGLAIETAANQAVEASVSAALEPAAPPANPAGNPAADRSQPLPATTQTAAAAAADGGRPLDFGPADPYANRVERRSQRGTWLVAERDALSGVSYYYHESTAQRRSGVFLEILRAGNGAWQARLAVQLSAAGPTMPAEAGRLSLSGLDLGLPRSGGTFPGGAGHILSLRYELDDRLLAELAEAIESSAPALTRPDGSTALSLGQADVSRLREMLDAYADLR